ncbi:MAG: alanine dehydrogenase [Chloroflexi bacterium]|uniref:alanine dehydrogenase n=1 Tax=Candidatus Flexifilum breve TaxID=3140694 RepID=UPI003136DF88|nr:alanine dehydrogenase [Chloroflexota bacterium]
MIIGIPKEIKDNEFRVALPPGGVRELTRRGHKVIVETNAGAGSGFTDNEYVQAGAQVAHTAAEAWNRAHLVLKVKEPLPSEYGYLRDDLILFAYLHLAANEDLTRAMMNSGVTGIAYETVENEHGQLPLLAPMSEVAGRMATQIAAFYLQKPEGGRGILMGGVPGVRPAHVVILGGGSVGTNAAQVALGMGANVTLLDLNTERLIYLDQILHGRLTTIYSNEINIREALATADAVIGAVLVAGARAPRLITREMLSIMPRSSVIVDVAVDQGGCVETTRPTTHSDPTYVVDGVLHYGVANMPGAVPRTSSFALSNATLRYILKLAGGNLRDVLDSDPDLAKGLNLYAGQVLHPAVAETFGLQLGSFDQLLTKVQ